MRYKKRDNQYITLLLALSISLHWVNRPARITDGLRSSWRASGAVLASSRRVSPYHTVRGGQQRPFDEFVLGQARLVRENEGDQLRARREGTRRLANGGVRQYRVLVRPPSRCIGGHDLPDPAGDGEKNL